MITEILCFVTFIVAIHYFVLHYGNRGRKINLIPGPIVVPFLGTLYMLQSSRRDIWETFRKLNAQYYKIYRLWSVTCAYINVHRPEHVETIIGNTKFTHKSWLYRILEPWLGTGLLTASGSKWQTRRKMLTPAFHFNVLQQFVDTIINEGELLIERLKKEGGPTVQDLFNLISECTLNTISETAMGISLKDPDMANYQCKYRQAMHDMIQYIIYRMVRPWFYSNAIFNLTPTKWLQSKLLKILHGFSRKIIQERKQYHEQTNGHCPTGDKDDSTLINGNDYLRIRKKKLAMLDLLISAHRSNQIDDEGIREEVDTFIFKGHDTTAVCICFTIMLFAEHKEIQDQARAEVKEVMERNDGKLNMTAIQELSYLERCIKESLRLYPSVPSISRETETNVKFGNYEVPNKTAVIVHIFDTHRDPRYWPNPTVFDPDRFLPENSRGRHPYSYIPFSAGPRNCIGQKFAMLELKSVMALLLYNFSLEPVDYLKDVQFFLDMVLRPSHPVRSKFVPL
ncbi:unnamed protein product [Xylocopa violacea]|uniref:Cytochrome P450 n=1 Tax=Xylocopa violacea TaxID=135666 RepID=A0ABP1NI01_XYLVO